MYIEEYFAGQHREDQNYFIIYWNYLNDTQRIKICRCVVVRLGKSWRMRSLKANLETRRRMLHRNHHNTIEKYLFSCRILQGPAHTKLTRPRKLAIELWKQSWLLSLNRIRLQDGACAALISSLCRSSTRCCRSGGMRSSRLSVWIHFSDNGPQFGYLETNDWIRGWSSVTHVGLRNDCLERKQSLASSDFAVKFSTNSWASRTLARQTICQVNIWKASCILLGLAISTASRIEL